MTIDEKALKAAARAVLHRRIKPDFFEVKDGAWTVDHDKVVAEAAILAYESAKQKEAEGWRELMQELADDLEVEIIARYPPGTHKYPSMVEKARLEMEPVRRARALLSAGGEG